MLTGSKKTFAMFADMKSGAYIVMCPVGCGASDVKILAPLHVPSCRVAVLLTEPALRDFLVNQYEKLRKSEKVPSVMFKHLNKGYIVADAPVLHVIAHSELSLPTGGELLNSLAPDLVMVDQARFRVSETRTRRLTKYVAENPSVRLLAFSYPGENNLPRIEPAVNVNDDTVMR